MNIGFAVFSQENFGAEDTQQRLTKLYRRLKGEPSLVVNPGL